eukprot:6934424-Alexandrium_andersonii.AAC.1
MASAAETITHSRPPRTAHCLCHRGQTWDVLGPFGDLRRVKTRGAWGLQQSLRESMARYEKPPY